MSNRVAIVTGGTSGIGLETAKALVRSGVTVYTLSRRDFSAEGMRHLKADITDEQAAQAAVRQVAQEQGHIDILVNCAGSGIAGAIEFTELSDAKFQFDVGFFGMVNMNKAVLPIMRQQHSGRIVNISSVAAPAAIPFQAYYSAVKAAINTYTLALQNEVKPFGITTLAIMPGDIKTGFTGARKTSLAGDDVYGGRIQRSVHKMELDEQNGATPEQAGAYIAKLALQKKVKPLYAIGFISKCEAVLLRLLPSKLCVYIVGKLYSGE